VLHHPLDAVAGPAHHVDDAVPRPVPPQRVLSRPPSAGPLTGATGRLIWGLRRPEGRPPAAEVAELADAPGSGPGSRKGSGGSSPLFGTACGERTYADEAQVLSSFLGRATYTFAAAPDLSVLAWNGRLVVRLARRIHDGRRRGDMLAHCRQQGHVHAKG